MRCSVIWWIGIKVVEEPASSFRVEDYNHIRSGTWEGEQDTWR